MNKWVVAILLVLAFAAGGLSMYKMGQNAGPSYSSATPTSSAAPEVSPTPVATGEGEKPLAKPTRVTGREPHFGRPGSNASPAARKPGVVMGQINAHIFSTKPDGPALTRFPSGTTDIYLTLTPIKMRDDVELVASLRSAMSEGAAFSEPVQSSGPPRLRTFRFAPPKEGWVPGPYQVVVKPAGSEQVLLLSRFEIEKPDAPKPVVYEAPEFLSLTKDTQEQTPQSVFATDDQQIYLIVSSGKVAGKKVRSVWSAVEVDQLTPGELVAASETTAPSEGMDASFNFAPPKGGFLPGSYRVDVYFDQQQVGSQAFFIQPAEEVADASSTPLATDTSTP